ncbi:uncharacterized protein LOC126907934 isoform X2 [Daktulosphaira vitifoliae]|uniref:uncharacterized protein LOC126907934 isoform X2 n=1 Tax=Daktulosphaira vitifoliae TaxID=58002 RepID=UPI0021AB05BE|nr:uncharacterized protein LOC126907934 isoform X2 [Daktulosphaira vitifoliae]
MKFYSFILISIAIFVSQPDEGVHCKSYHIEYKNYIERVISYIYSQIISYQKQDSNNTTGMEETIQPKTNPRDFTQKYHYTISILNFNYIQILHEYRYYMKIIINQCIEFKKENLLENFIDCVMFLEKQVKNSKTMFEKFYNAVKFISYIDIRFLFSEGAVTHAITDEMDFIYQYLLEKNKEDSSDLKRLPYYISEYKFKNIESFNVNLYWKIFDFNTNFFKQNKILDIYINSDVDKLNIAKLPQRRRSYAILSKKSELLTIFYNENIEIWYNNLGFEQFLNPTAAEFIPPIDPDTNQNDGIEALNIIRKESGWEKMNHISIVYFGRKISVDRIINDEVSNINFRIKKEHVSQLLRCRFTEIMKNYRTLLSAILFVCNKDAYECYHNCLIKLFSSFNESKKMHEDLYEALVTLNKSSIWTVNLTSKSSLYKIFKWVTGFLSLLEKNDIFLKNVGITHDDNNTEMIEQYLVIFKNYFNIFSANLRSDLILYDTRCSIDDKFENVKDYVSYFRNLGNISVHSNYEMSSKIMLNAFNFYGNFCENVSKSCYEDLGFEKLSHCKKKELDSKLI